MIYNIILFRYNYLNDKTKSHSKGATPKFGIIT
jgi:hypothetical protein